MATNGKNYEDAPTDTEEEDIPVEGEVVDPDGVLDASGAPLREAPPVARRARRAPTVRHGAPAVAPERESDHPSQVQSRDIVDRWPAVIAWLERKFNLGPDAVKINVGAIAQGPYSGAVPSTSLGSIPGECVGGDSVRGPDEALRDWVIDVFHGIQRGPVKYDFRFYFKTKPPGVNHSQICVGELSLNAPEIVAAQRRAAQEAFSRATRGGSVSMPH